MEYPWRAIPLAALTQQARLVAGPLLDPPAGGPSPRALGKPDKSFGIERMVLPDRIELSREAPCLLKLLSFSASPVCVVGAVVTALERPIVVSTRDNPLRESVHKTNYSVCRRELSD
jgi:hypothetical protein